MVMGTMSPSGVLDNELLGLPVEDLDEATAEGIRMGENNEVPILSFNMNTGWNQWRIYTRILGHSNTGR